MSQNASEVIAPDSGNAPGGQGGSFFSRMSTSSKILAGILAVVVLAVVIFALVGIASSPSSTSTSSTPILPSATPSTSSPTTTAGSTGTTLYQVYGSRDPFVPLTLATASATASPSPSSPTTTVASSTGVVTPTSTVTTTPSQIALVSVSPVGQPAVAQVTVNGTSFAGLTSGTSFDNGAYTITAINQATGCATFTNGGSTAFQICLAQAVLK